MEGLHCLEQNACVRLQLQLENISGKQLVVAEESESKMLFSFLLLIGTVTCQLQEGLPNPTVPTKQPTNHPVTTEIVILKEQNKRVEKVFEVNEELNKDLTFQWQVDVNSNSTEKVRVILQHGNDTKSFDLPYARTLNRDKKLEKAPISGRSIVLCPKEMVNKDSILVVTLISSSNNPIEVIISAKLESDENGWEFLDAQDQDKRTRAEGMDKSLDPVGSQNFLETKHFGLLRKAQH